MQEHKVIVAGGREFSDYPKLSAELFAYAESLGPDVGMSIVSGMARGADKLAWTFAKAENAKVYEFPADWDKHGKRAGFLRNEQMGQFADAALIFWDGKSRGTKHMIDYMTRLGKPVHIVRY